MSFLKITYVAFFCVLQYCVANNFEISSNLNDSTKKYFSKDYSNVRSLHSPILGTVLLGGLSVKQIEPEKGKSYSEYIDDLINQTAFAKEISKIVKINDDEKLTIILRINNGFQIRYWKIGYIRNYLNLNKVAEKGSPDSDGYWFLVNGKTSTRSKFPYWDEIIESLEKIRNYSLSAGFKTGNIGFFPFMGGFLELDGDVDQKKMAGLLEFSKNQLSKYSKYCEGITYVCRNTVTKKSIGIIQYIEQVGRVETFEF